MSNDTWSYLVTAVGLVGFFLAGNKVWWAWYVNIGCQVLWFYFGLTSGQHGFLIGAFFYTGVFTKNAIAWTREHFEKQREEATHGLHQARTR